MSVSFPARTVARPLLLASLISSLALSCSSEPKEGAGAVLVMRTDMKVPEGVRSVGVYITRIEPDGRSRSIFSQRYETTETPDGNKVSLPGRLSLQNTADEGVRVHVRVIAFDVNDRATTMREARMQLPTDSVRALSLPLLWMNSGEVIDNGEGAGSEDAIARFSLRACPDGQGLDDMGTCRSIEIDARDLPKYEDKDTNEGGDAAVCDEDCFDVAQCFRAESEEGSDWNFRALRARIGWFDEANGDCGIPFNEPIAEMVREDSTGQIFNNLKNDLALAVRVPAAEGAFCNPAAPSECYVPLDAAAFGGFDDTRTMLQPRGEKGLWALLPPGVCRKWSGNNELINAAIIAAPRCKRKTPDQRICTRSRPLCAGKIENPKGWNGADEIETDAGDGGVRKDCTVLYATSLFSDGKELIVGTPMPAAYKVSTTNDFNATCFTSQLNGDNNPAKSIEDALRLVKVGQDTNRLGGMRVNRQSSSHMLRDSSDTYMPLSLSKNGCDDLWSVGPNPHDLNAPPISIGSRGGQVIGSDNAVENGFCGGSDNSVILSNGIPFEGSTRFIRSSIDQPFLDCSILGGSPGSFTSVNCEPISINTSITIPPILQNFSGAAQSAAVGNDGNIYVLYQSSNGAPLVVATLVVWSNDGMGWTPKAFEPTLSVSPLMDLVVRGDFVYFITSQGQLFRANSTMAAPLVNLPVHTGMFPLSMAVVENQLYWLEGYEATATQKVESLLYRADFPPEK